MGAPSFHKIVVGGIGDAAIGRIDRDSTGQPTGILRETASAAVTAVIPTPNHDRRRRNQMLARELDV